jgi:hypothetical protein
MSEDTAGRLIVEENPAFAMQTHREKKETEISVNLCDLRGSPEGSGQAVVKKTNHGEHRE